ncbi:hypothetical protein CTEN210_16127 [Chaetoceros tenuissimus]|uniref:Molybdate-anion transporter n=1 Tax=Chaetoceros tenuissimus TaxID=426638 RepID=A0AAD3D870_9STRA|nr:hypothetical protein CTEN210_16127 [Chaetoceros tenuissimus]
MKISLVDLQTAVSPSEEDAGFPGTPTFSPPDSDDEFVMMGPISKASGLSIPCLDASIISQDYHLSEHGEDDDYPTESSFNFFRLQYLIVYMAIMLADGLQGTHLYVLYEGYGYSVASLYCLGFVSGAFSSPFIGAFVDKFGRKRAAALYCVLEMIINQMEQHPMLIGLIAARVIGGVTTNLLGSCFEAWLVTEHRNRKFDEESLELLMRDSSIISNSAAIFSGFLAHALAEFLGPVGPFQGAVATTSIALTLVLSIWTENYGSSGNDEVEMSIFSHMRGAFETIKNDSRILRIGIIQGLAEGALQTFVFLWSPALRTFATYAPSTALGIDSQGEPAYGLIFGSFMASAVFGGFIAPIMRKIVSSVLCHGDGILAGQGLDPVPVSVMTSLCYGIGSILLFVPCMLKEDSNLSFSVCLAAFVLFELFVGIYVPSEGVLRSIYMPSEELRSMYNKIGFHHSDVLNSAFVIALVEVAYMILFE